MTEAFDNLKLCSYLFVADSFDNCKKIFDSFLPLIESVLVQIGNKPSISFLALQQKVDEIYNTSIPKATLKTLLYSLKAEGKINIDKNYININGEMLDSKYYQERDIKEQEIRELFLGFREFLLKRDIKITLDEAKHNICKYIFTRCYDLANFIDLSVIPEQTEVESSSPIIALLCEFLFECKRNNVTLYNAFLRLYKGAVQSTLLNFNPDKIESLQNNNLKIEKVILDSNFLMRVLDIQTEVECQIAQETLRILKSQKIQFIVLPQTLDEISGSIKAFLNDSAPYTRNTREYLQHHDIKMSGLLSAIQRGKSRTFLLKLSRLSILRDTLETEHGIYMLNDDKKLSDNLDEEISSLIETKAKDGYGSKQAVHDLSLISYCRSIRDKRVDSFSDAKCWVLTNDIKLSFWNQRHCTGIQECISEGQLSNLLWLQTPKEDNAGLANTMVTLANNALIDPATFYIFINKMQAYKESIKEKPSAVDNFSLIFACDCFTTVDVQRITSDDQEIEHIINEKAELVRQEREDKELLLHQSSDENAKLKLELKLSQLTSKKYEYLKTLTDNKHEQESLTEKTRGLCEERADTFKIEKLREKAGRRLATAIIGMIVILAIVVGTLSSDILSFISKIVKWLNVINLPEWIKSVLLTIFITPIFSLIITVILFLGTALFTGIPMKPTECFNYYKEKLLKRMIKVSNLPFVLHSADLVKKRETIDSLFKQHKERECLLKEQQQDIEHCLVKVEMALGELVTIQ